VQAQARADLARMVGLGWRNLAALPALAGGAALVLAGGRYGALPVYSWAGPALQAVGVGLGLWGAVKLWPARAAARWVQRLAAGGIVLMLLRLPFPAPWHRPLTYVISRRGWGRRCARAVPSRGPMGTFMAC